MALFDWDWGSVPAWFSGGSLAAAFYIIIRDRRNSQTAQADKLTGWLEDDQADPQTAHVVLHNSSDVYLTHIAVTQNKSTFNQFRDRVGRKSARKDRRKWKATEYHYVQARFPQAASPTSSVVSIAPKVELRGDLVMVEPHRFRSTAVHFTDGRGRHWEKTLESGRLRKVSSAEPDLYGGVGFKAGLLLIVPVILVDRANLRLRRIFRKPTK